MSESLSLLEGYMDEVLHRQIPEIQFNDVEMVGKAKPTDMHRGAGMNDPHAKRKNVVSAPVQVRMEEGHRMVNHMLSQIKNASLWESQDVKMANACLMMIGGEPKKTFEVIDDDTGYPAVVIKEKGHCFERNFFPNKCRPFEFVMFARASRTELKPAVFMKKGCSWGKFSKNKQMTLTNKGGQVLGYVTPKSKLASMNFIVTDAKSREIFTLTGNRFQLSNLIGKMCCGPFKQIKFKTLDTRGNVIAEVDNNWGGCCREILGDADDFSISMGSRQMSSEDKVLLLSAAVYTDMKYFSTCCSFSLRDLIFKRIVPAPIRKGLNLMPVAYAGCYNAKMMAKNKTSVVKPKKF